MIGLFSNMKGISFSWLIYAAFLICSPLGAANLHLFIVADYDSKELMPALGYDVSNIRSEARTICNNTGLKLKETILSGTKARTSQVWSKLRSLAPTKDDTVLFYYSGHGFRMPSKGDSPWPDIYLSAEDKAIDVTDVVNFLNRTKARLRLVIADCCNNVIPDGSVAIVRKHPLASVASDRVKANYVKLFLRTKGSIVVAGCKPGETSLALRKGSLYTLTFLDVLHQELNKITDLVDWQTLLDIANAQASEWATTFDEVQNPIFLIGS